MNEQIKTELSQDLKKMLMEMYDKGFKDCEAAAMQAIEAGIRQAIFSEREACAKLCENGAFLHDQAPDALFGRAVARAIRARGNHE